MMKIIFWLVKRSEIKLNKFMKFLPQLMTMLGSSFPLESRKIQFNLNKSNDFEALSRANEKIEKARQRNLQIKRKPRLDR